jgi:hypothetical protein
MSPRIGRVAAVVAVCITIRPSLLASQAVRPAGPPWPPYTDPSACRPDSGDAREALTRTWHAMGLDRIGNRVVHFGTVDIVRENYQSDRPYPPFFSVPRSRDLWYDPDGGFERGFVTEGVLFGNGKGPVTADDGTALYRMTESTFAPYPAGRWAALQDRPLNAWAEVGDFRRSADARVVASCVYRGFRRAVIARRGPWGEERLLLDSARDLPVAMLREEPHYLWGQQRVAYVYSLWDQLDSLGGLRPRSAVRMTDGASEIERLEGPWRLVDRDSMPPVPRGRPAENAPIPLPVFLQALPVDTERVGGNAWVLRNRGYREALTMVHDTVYLFDTTESEDRARLDSAWIARLYPRHRAVVVVVTDLAWPHVGGVRYWVARGATIVSHRLSRDFLQRVVARRWTRSPDLLERERRSGRAPAFHFVPVSDSLEMAGAAVRLFPIDGIASEGTLMAFLPESGTLWASDFVQSVDAPTEYAREVWQAVRRHGLHPLTVVAEHIAPASWSRLERLVSP